MKFVLVVLIFTTINSSGQKIIENVGEGGATANGVCNGCPPPAEAESNYLTFTYDVAGNQIQRRLIYVVSTGRPGNVSNDLTFGSPVEVDKEFNLIQSEFTEILYYPNPVQSELFVSWTEANNEDISTIELIDFNGKLLRTFTSVQTQSNATISFDIYPTGLYNLSFVYTSGYKRTLKIVKQ